MLKSGLLSFSYGGVVTIVEGKSLVSNWEDDISTSGSERVLHWFFLVWEISEEGLCNSWL